MIYLDYNATSPVKPAVRGAMVEAMERHGNPSSVHRFGRIARRSVEEARARVAALAGVRTSQVIFTASGTEANNMVFRGSGCKNFMTSAVEHDSVLVCTPHAVRLPVTEDGAVDVSKAADILRRAPAGTLVSVMLVNNETGVIQPVSEIAALACACKHLLHIDAVQAAGRLPIDFCSLGADFLTFSAHKIGGPQGVGALIMSDKIGLQPLVKGGGQEMNRRAGTENVAGIVGFGIAAQLAADDLRDGPRLSLWRDQIQRQLQAIAGPDALILGAAAPRVANTLCIAMRGVKSETQVMAMDLAGVAVSSGAACSSGKLKASHVLRAMGLGDDIVGSAVRISLGWNTKMTDLERCVEAWRSVYNRTHKDQNSQAA